MAAARVRVAARGKEGVEEQVVAGRPLMLQGGPGREGAAVEATAARRSWRQCFHCRHRKKKEGERPTGGSLCQGFSIFCFSEIPGGLGNCFRPLNLFKNSGKIHRAIIYYLEPLIKFAAHLKNILCVNISEFALLHFRALFNYLHFQLALNFATIIFVVVGTSWTNMRI